MLQSEEAKTLIGERASGGPKCALTLLLITDEPLLEAGLRAVLAGSPEFDFRGSYKHPGMVAAAGVADPDIVVCALNGEMEVPLPDLRRAFPRTGIVVMRREFSPEFAYQALDAGIRGFVSNMADTEALLECLRKAGRGELWMENRLSMMLLDTRPVRLSKRQSELIYLLAQGLKNKEIAGILGISEGTVKAYLTVLFEKIGAKDRFELALFGLKHVRHMSGQQIVDQRVTRSPRSFVPRRVEKLIIS